MRAIPIQTGQVSDRGGSIAKVTGHNTVTATVDLYDGTGVDGVWLGSFRILANYMFDVDFEPRLPYNKLYAVVSAGTAFVYVED